jgi:DNA invertase Pin-like site-specific DNA recombinase
LQALTPARVYSDKLSGTSTREQRPGLAALLDCAREGDAIVVVGIDRLGRNAAEVMTLIRDLGQRGIVLRSLREGIDTSNATGRMVAGVLASLAELELELGRERRSAAREARRARGQAIGRPKALDQSKAALAQRMHGSGESGRHHRGGARGNSRHDLSSARRVDGLGHNRRRPTLTGVVNHAIGQRTGSKLPANLWALSRGRPNDGVRVLLQPR